MKTLRIYFAYFLQFLMQRLAYKGDFFASIFSNMLVTIGGLLFVIFLLDGQTIQSLQGWSRSEVLFIYGYAMISMALFSTVAPNLYRFGDKYIIEGQFDRVLLRPLNSACQVLFESFNLESIGSLCIGVGTLLYASESLSITYSLIDILWLIVSSFSAAVILLSVFVLIASLSFHFEDRVGIAPPVYNLIAFGRYPLPVFNNVIQFILRWIVPFAFVAFYPATHFLKRQGFELFCYLTPFVAIVSASIAALAWTIGVRSYQSTGS